MGIFGDFRMLVAKFQRFLPELPPDTPIIFPYQNVSGPHEFKYIDFVRPTFRSREERKVQVVRTKKNLAGCQVFGDGQLAGNDGGE